METSGPPGIIKPFRLENIWVQILGTKISMTSCLLGFLFNLFEVVSLVYGPVDNYWNNLNTSSFQPFHIAADEVDNVCNGDHVPDNDGWC